jgi:sulfur relay (sulfurtransferase) DsrC/TusE family protein
MSNSFYNDIRNIILSAQNNAIRSVDFQRVLMYWHLGERIFLEEQQGKDRAEYGEHLIKNISKQLENEFGSGFSYRQLAYCRQFYRLYPIVNAVRSQFVARQKRILLEDDEFFVDLVFYNRILRCFVIIEIKTHKLSHEDLGQLQMYVNYYDRYEKSAEESPTVGILLCTAKNDLLAKITLPENNTQILTNKYQLYLPSEKELVAEVKKLLGEAQIEAKEMVEQELEK